jgi:polysaccharide biosynthesis protein PslG
MDICLILPPPAPTLRGLVYPHRSLTRTARVLRLRFILLAALSALALALPAAASAAPTVGVTIDSPGTNAATAISQLNLAVKLHMKVVRIEILWNLLEPNGAGRYDPAVLAATDQFFAAAAQRHLKVLVIMDSTPCWASSAPSNLTNGCHKITLSGGYTSWPPSDPNDFAHVAAFVAARYRTQLEAFEVWNEPDQSNQLYWAGPNKPQRYAAMLRATYPAIKAVAPNLPVLAGALVGWNGVFLKQLYAAGIKGYYDGLSVHYYDLVLADLRVIHQVQLANGDTKPLWLGEFGWASCAPLKQQDGGQFCVTPQVEAQNLVDIIRATRKTSYIKEMYVYNMDDSAQYSLGLIDRNGNPKPAFAALQKQLGARVSPPVRLTRVSLRASHGRAVLSGGGPAGDFYGLSVYKDGVLRLAATVQLKLNNTFSYKLPPVLGSKGLKISFYQLWQGKKHAITRTL